MNGLTLIPLLIYLSLLPLIAWFSSRKREKNIDEYFIGGRSMGGFFLAMTLGATYINSSSFIGGPGLAYVFGLSWILLASTQFPVMLLILGILGKRLTKAARKCKAVTFSDIIAARYQSSFLTNFSSIVMIILFIAGAAMGASGGARLMESMTGLGYRPSLFIFFTILTVYTTFGGFRAVVATDVLQGFTMIAATLGMGFFIISSAGGVAAAMEKIHTIDPNLLSPTSGGNLSPFYIGSFWILVCFGMAGHPLMAVRCMTLKNDLALRRAIILGTIITGTIMLGIHFNGLLGRLYLPEGTLADKVIPELGVNFLPPILSGIFIGGLLAAVMSTVDSFLIMITGTLIKNFLPQRLQKYKFSKGINLIICLFILILALEPPAFIARLSILIVGGVESVFLWMILFGIFSRRINAVGATAGAIGGLASYVGISLWMLSTNVMAIFGVHQIVLSLPISLLCLIAFNPLGKPISEKTKAIFFES